MGVLTQKGSPTEKVEEDFPLNHPWYTGAACAIPPLPLDVVDVNCQCTPPLPGTVVALLFPGRGEGGAVFATDPLPRHVGRVDPSAAGLLAAWAAASCRGLWGEWEENGGRFRVRLHAA